MKSLITAIVIFLATLSICAASFFLATSFGEDMVYRLEKIEESLENGDFPAAYKASANAVEKIEQSNFYMAAIANHSELGTMKNGLLKICQHIKDKKEASALLAVVETRELFQHFLHSERLTLENIF